MTNPFGTPVRQSPYAIIFILGNVFRQLLGQLWWIILAIFLNPRRQMFDNYTAVIIVLTLVGAFSAILNYFRQYFYIHGGELILEKGVLRKIKITVPLDRIQSVNFKQGILHQMLNVTGVEIDTAGSAGNEFSLQALDKKQAEALRSYLESFRHQRADAMETSDGFHHVEEDAALPDPVPEKIPATNLLFRLRLIDLVKIGAGQNHLRTAGIIAAFILGFAENVADILDIRPDKKLKELANNEHFLNTFRDLFLVAIPLLMIISFLGTLIRTVLHYYDFQCWRTERGFKIVSGLFTREEVFASLKKIQLMRWKNGPLLRFYGMQSVQIMQASPEMVNLKSSLYIPGCYHSQLTEIRETVFPGEPESFFEEHPIDDLYARRLFVWQGILPVLILLFLMRQFPAEWIWLPLLWMLPAWWISLHSCRSWRWCINEQGLRLKHGWLEQNTTILQWYKVQGVSIHQSIFMKRRGLATVVFSTASGTIRIPFIQENKAHTLQNFVLYRIETDHRNWM